MKDPPACRLYDEPLPSPPRAAGVPEGLNSEPRDELVAFRGHSQVEGDEEVSRGKNIAPDRLYEVVDDIHIRLDEADRRHRASHPVSTGSRGTKSNKKSLAGSPA